VRRKLIEDEAKETMIIKAAPPVSRIGSHVAVAGGLVRKGLAEAAEIGAEVIQIFVGSPRGWAPPRIDPGAARDFRERCEALELPVFVHAAYLINLAAPQERTLDLSVEALTATLHAAELVGARGVVVHAGSSVVPGHEDALRRVRSSFKRVLEGSPASVRLLLEPTAGGGRSLASTLESTAEYLDAVDDVRVGVCLDTCHLHAAGEALGEPGRLAAGIAQLTSDIGAGRIGLVHVNDSKDACGSRRDRHESLGSGQLGADAFEALFAVPELAGVPMVVETPTHAPDVAFLNRVRASRPMSVAARPMP
jgi:deoxyribonuclease-4